MPLLFFLFFTLIVFAPSAYADTFIVQVTGLNPKTSPKTATCTEQNKPCFLSLPLPEENGGTDYIDVAADFAADKVRFQFMQNREYMPLRGDGKTMVTIPLESTEIVQLFDPETVERDGLIKYPVLRNGRPVARLQILAFRQIPK